MRACQSLGFYLIAITSEREIANSVMNLNAWEEIRPLKYIHNGPTENVRGQPGHGENKTPDWRQIDWTHEQLKSVVVIHEGEFDDCSFITAGLTPTDALVRARERRNETSSRCMIEDPDTTGDRQKEEEEEEGFGFGSITTTMMKTAVHALEVLIQYPRWWSNRSRSQKRLRRGVTFKRSFQLSHWRFPLAVDVDVQRP